MIADTGKHRNCGPTRTTRAVTQVITSIQGVGPQPRRQCYITTRRNRGRVERSEGEEGERSHRAEGMSARKVSSRVPAWEED